MPKKRTNSKSSTSNKTVIKKAPVKKRDIEQKLVENLVSLQKVHTDLAVKFDKLTKEISSLLALFEVTAKNFAKNAPRSEFEKDEEFLEKIDKLLDQNKTIAKGLTMMERRMKERVYGAPVPKETQQSYNTSIGTKRPLPRF